MKHGEIARALGGRKRILVVCSGRDEREILSEMKEVVAWCSIMSILYEGRFPVVVSHPSGGQAVFARCDADLRGRQFDEIIGEGTPLMRQSVLSVPV